MSATSLLINAVNTVKYRERTSHVFHWYDESDESVSSAMYEELINIDHEVYILDE